MRHLLRLALLAVFSAGVAQACDFQVEPASGQSLYRSDGWILPGLTGGQLTAPAQFPPLPDKLGGWRSHPASMPGLTLRVIIQPEGDARVLEFQRQEFSRGDKNGVMPHQVMLLSWGWVYRYEVNGKVVAYTYGLTPAFGQKVNGKWKIENELGCEFYSTFVDDRGDGIFRELFPGALAPDLVPQWALDSKKSPT